MALWAQDGTRPGKWLAGDAANGPGADPWALGGALPDGPGWMIAAAAVLALLVWRLTRGTSASSAAPEPLPMPGQRGCPWKRVRGKDTATLQRWVCRRCGVEAFSADTRPPKECKRDLRTNL